jgi:hypothetical protein
MLSSSLPCCAPRVRLSRMRATRSTTAPARAVAAAADAAENAYKANLVTRQADISALAAAARRVAVLGIKTADKARRSRGAR